MTFFEKFEEFFCFLFGFLLFVGLILCTCCFVFSPYVSAAEDPALEDRFYAPEGRDGVGTVIVDRETGVCYLWRKEGYGAGMTLLVDAEGDPLLWDEEKP